MSQLMLDKRGPREKQREKCMISQRKEAQTGVFSSQIVNYSAAKRAQTRKIKRKKGPQYRQMGAYTKSIKQYKKERSRRKRVRQLAAAGFTYPQIAVKLGVSEKTVYRDVKKLRPYILGQMCKQWRLWDEQRQHEFSEKMDGLTLWQRYKLLSQEMAKQRKLLQGRSYRGHYTILMLDLTDTDKYGIPKFTQLPHQTKSQPLAYPYKVRVVVKGSYEGRTFEATIGGFNIIQTRRW